MKLIIRELMMPVFNSILSPSLNRGLFREIGHHLLLQDCDDHIWNV